MATFSKTIFLSNVNLRVNNATLFSFKWNTREKNENVRFPVYYRPVNNTKIVGAAINTKNQIVQFKFIAEKWDFNMCVQTAAR